jgi:DNA-binding GntR family transcriptional regulator
MLMFRPTRIHGSVSDLPDSESVLRLAPSPGSRQSDQAFELIKREIMLCRMAPGLRFSEGQLSERLGLGRAAARAALIRLADLGMVQPVARHGYIVTPISIGNLRDLFELRLILEPQATALAVGRVDVAELIAINRQPQLARTADARVDFVDANRAFHQLIARATGNRRLIVLLESIADEMQRLVQLGLFGVRDSEGDLSDQAAADSHHEALISAFEAGDRAAAERVARVHIEHLRDLVMRRLLEGRVPTGVG